jgi:hypothetical protein
LEIKGKTPPIITALIVTCVYNCFKSNTNERLYSEKRCAFIEYFESKEKGMKFINSDQIYKICEQLHYTDEKMNLRSNIRLYNKHIPYIRTQLEKCNSAHFYKKSISLTDLCKRFSVDVFIEFVNIPVVNNKTILSLQTDNHLL